MQVSFSYLLPLAALFAWTLQVPVPATIMFCLLRSHAPSGRPMTLSAGEFQIRVPQDRVGGFILEWVAAPREHSIVAVNLPGILVEVLISLPTSWPILWHPAGMEINVWETLSFPFFASPGWWFVGRGFDRFIKRKRPSLAVILVSSLVSSFCLIFVIYFTVGEKMPEIADMLWVLCGFAFWSLAFGALPITWLLQRKWKLLEPANDPA